MFADYCYWNKIEEDFVCSKSLESKCTWRECYLCERDESVGKSVSVYIQMESEQWYEKSQGW